VVAAIGPMVDRKSVILSGGEPAHFASFQTLPRAEVEGPAPTKQNAPQHWGPRLSTWPTFIFIIPFRFRP
jgi:organic radical activating enzyme